MNPVNPEIIRLKESHLDQLSAYTEELYRKPDLRHLFLELTLACNERCFHCGSNCSVPGKDELSADEFKAVIDQVKEDFDISRIQLCVTGGEPLLRKDFFEIMSYANSKGFKWGMTSNATLITKDVAHKLSEAGMGTISVSIDGLQDTHDKLRGMKNAYDLAMQGVQNLIDENAFKAIQITTVVNHENVRELDQLLEIMKGIDIDSWRVINIEPIGRALLRPEMLCTKEDLKYMFEFIRKARKDGLPVEYGCSHYLVLDYEVEVRDWYWLCNAGVYTASIMSNGDIGACLDIERSPKTIQGNIRRDRLKEVWDNRFEFFRRNKACDSDKCRNCNHSKYCRGDAAHSWNYINDEPLICMKGVLFE